jgi:hypothetical protein
MENNSHESEFPRQELNPRLTEHEAEILPTSPRRSVPTKVKGSESMKDVVWHGDRMRNKKCIKAITDIGGETF